MNRMGIRLVSFHHNKSTGVGGIEGLIRHLHEVSNLIGNKYVETFHGVSGKELFPETEGVKYVKLHGAKGKRTIVDKAAELYKLHQNYADKYLERDDVLLFFSPRYLLFVPSVTLKKKKVILVQANKFEHLFKFWGKAALKFRFKYVDLFTVYTANDKDKLQSYYPEAKGKIEIIPRGCKIDPSSMPAIFSRKLVTIARIDERQKNFKAMLEIMKNLPRGYSLDIYGVGEKKEIDNIRKLIADCENVRYMGGTSKVDEILKKYSVFIMTSNYEGFGQTLIEARSQGLPIVAYDTFDALKYIVEDGANGKLVDRGDYVGFCDAIVDITTVAHVFKEYSNQALLKSKETSKERVTEIWKKTLLSL